MGGYQFGEVVSETSFIQSSYLRPSSLHAHSQRYVLIQLTRPPQVLYTDNSAGFFHYWPISLFWGLSDRLPPVCLLSSFHIIQEGGKVSLQLRVWKRKQLLINHNTRINCVFHGLTTINLLLLNPVLLLCSPRLLVPVRAFADLLAGVCSVLGIRGSTGII